MLIGEVNVTWTFVHFEKHLMELGNVEGFALADIKVYYKALVIKTGCGRHLNNYANRRE